MSTLLRHVYCFLSQGKLENEFLWAEAERVREGVREGGAHVWGSEGGCLCGGSGAEGQRCRIELRQ